MIPTNAHELRLASLRRANEIRSLRADLKQRMTRGQVTLSETLEAEHDWTRTMRVVELLKVVPALGPVKVNRAATALNISTGLTLGHLTLPRRLQLLSWLSINCPRAEIGEWR